ncbi:hypothetical protein O6H91_09G115200 [Diphasiastrum complanatum]|uniref:Uncharacterized protein n=1 Tax=Diphasiastrum complanatum TaxID=34168 RepID=A0ACC2CUI8_DIPCM|nr:hypothetical protein O6H91_09G115200 [Diphasiastrum complanatum]
MAAFSHMVIWLLHATPISHHQALHSVEEFKHLATPFASLLFIELPLLTEGLHREIHRTGDSFICCLLGTSMGHFLLTNLLLDNIIATAKKYGIEGMTIIVSSNAHFLIKALDLKTMNDQKR